MIFSMVELAVASWITFLEFVPFKFIFKVERKKDKLKYKTGRANLVGVDNLLNQYSHLNHLMLIVKNFRVFVVI